MQQLNFLLDRRLAYRRRLQPITQRLVVKTDMTIGFAPHWLNVIPVVNEFGDRHLFTSFPLPLTLGEGRGEGRSYRYRVEALLPSALNPNLSPRERGNGTASRKVQPKLVYSPDSD